jgi:hypothetical protein
MQSGQLGVCQVTFDGMLSNKLPFASHLCSQSETIVGRIDNILDNGNGKAVVIMDVFQVSATRHEIFGMPVLTRRQSETTYIIVPSLVRPY